jgi:hypothetical protein
MSIESRETRACILSCAILLIRNSRSQLWLYVFLQPLLESIGIYLIINTRVGFSDLEKLIYEAL